MAKFLKVGRRLHGLDGSQTIESVEEGEEVAAYNLVVDAFHTYFVGDTQLLVHDNSCPRPTLSAIPGWRASEVTGP